MALSQSTTKLSITMDRDSSPNPVFVIKDTTDYVGNGETLTNIKAALKIEYGNTVVYNNLSDISSNPDISGSSAGQVNEDLLRSRTQAVPIGLPKTASGEIVQGIYTITYNVTNGTDTITNQVSVDATFTKPTADLDATVDVTPTSPSIVVTDNTNYVVRNVTPTGTTTLKLYYPADVGFPPSSVTASSLTVTTFYVGTQVATLSAVKTWDYSGKIDTASTNTFSSGNLTWLISDTVTAREQVVVEANNNICALFCCLEKFAEKLEAAKSRPSEYASLQDKAGLVSFYFNSIDAAYQCSSTSNVNEWVQEIRDIIGCNDDCGCDGDKPVQITGIAEGSLVLGNIISFVTSGNTATYQNNNLIGATYSSTFQSFQVFADGLKVTGSFNSTTGTFTPTYPWSTGVQVEIVRLRG